MKFKKFFIKNYRAITDKIEINLKKNSLIPIIGINESGKTTILQAIFAFDYFNDKLNKGSHLKDTHNLYATSKKSSMITAIIDVSQKEYDDVLKDTIKKNDDIVFGEDLLKEYNKFKIINNELSITRNLHTTGYTINDDRLKDRKLNNKISKIILTHLPYIFYFDDFRDSIEDTIEIKKLPDGTIPGWLSIIEQLFKKTSDDYSVFDLKTYEPRHRKSILSKIKKKLNKTLTKEWQNFKLDKSDALKIDITYEPSDEKEFIKLEVIEIDSNDEEHYFYIRDRSKGFFWFFNFVMKLEFNPKSIGPEDSNSLYLLDEPGSYLHASAQSKLAKKLSELSKNNKVIYCTHSHYLLNPDIIPINSIRIAGKNENGRISIFSIAEYKGNIKDRRSAFQPILDSLQIKPLIFDMTNKNILIVEGIYDYYCFEMFKDTNNFKVLPSVGADSIKYYISLMILAQKSYLALWDNDEKGIEALNNAKKYFGIEEAKKFRTLKKNNKKTILQNLFDGAEYKMLKNRLKIASNSSFETVILNLFFNDNKEEIISKMPLTKNNFTKNIKLLDFNNKQ